jgi:hypothetical protein
MKKGFLLILAVLLSLTAPAQADEQKLGVTFDFSYWSKWLTKGAEGYGQQGALFETIDFDWYGSGLGSYVTHRAATASGYVDKERFDYGVYYKSSLFEDRPYITNYRLRWQYEHYPGLARNVANTTNEWEFTFSWPKLLKSGLTPKYVAWYEYPAGSGYVHNDVTGWVHLFGLDYDWAVPGLLSATAERVLHLSANIAYTDGIGGKSKDSDWSHATFGVSTKFQLNDRVAFVPGLYYQHTMDKSIAKRKDILYTVLSMKYKF